MINENVTLYRPVGQKEMDQINDSGNREFPPRLPSEAIFYPVLEEAYATHVARDWNVYDPDAGYAGYVTRFHVRSAFLERYAPLTVAGSDHHEYWIPAADLPELNGNIVGQIEVIAQFKRPKR
jgi:hypothetical protein